VAAPANGMKNFASLALLVTSPAFAQKLPDQLLHHWDYDQRAPLNIKQSGVPRPQWREDL
jgi:hypothetical protein